MRHLLREEEALELHRLAVEAILDGHEWVEANVRHEEARLCRPSQS